MLPHKIKLKINSRNDYDGSRIRSEKKKNLRGNQIERVVGCQAS